MTISQPSLSLKPCSSLPLDKPQITATVLIPDQRHLGVFKLSGLEVGSSQVLLDLNVGMFEELLQAVFIHLDGRDVLLLLHVDVSNIQPHVTKVSRGFTDLNQVERS